MSLAETIHAALAPTIGMLTREFGHSATVRQQAETMAADGSTVLIDRKAPGFTDPITIILTPISEANAQRDWGRESDVSVVGLLPDSVALSADYRLVVETGPLAGQTFAIVGSQPEPTGGIVQYGLKRVA